MPRVVCRADDPLTAAHTASAPEPSRSGALPHVPVPSVPDPARRRRVRVHHRLHAQPRLSGDVVGLSPLQLVLVGTLMETVCFVAQVPTGVIADRYSRRLSVIAGYLLMGAGLAVWGLLPTYAGILTATVIWSVGVVCVDGAEEAWAADEIEPGRVAGAFVRGGQLAQAGSLLGIVAAVALTAVGPALPFLAGAGVTLALGVLLIVAMTEDNWRPAEVGSWRSMHRQVVAGARAVRHSAVLAGIVAGALFAGMSSEGFDRLSQPFLLPHTGGHPAELVFGGLAAAAALGSILATGLAGRWIDAVRPRSADPEIDAIDQQRAGQEIDAIDQQRAGQEINALNQQRASQEINAVGPQRTGQEINAVDQQRAGQEIDVAGPQRAERGIDAAGSRRVGRTLAVIQAATAVGMIGLGFAGRWQWAVALYLGVRLLRDTAGPVLDVWLVSATASSSRATVYSIVAQADALGQMAGGPPAGVVAHRRTIGAGISVAGLFVLPAVALFALASRARPAEVSEAGAAAGTYP
ncbi:MFS transporter [Actinoplanes sp. URMC 104]|uniref:MFS transporter n=1 Tax=Actinoplanes sp. URMC 104 TaxID=3423409 RepID=UPI003F1CD9FC